MIGVPQIGWNLAEDNTLIAQYQAGAPYRDIRVGERSRDAIKHRISELIRLGYIAPRKTKVDDLAKLRADRAAEAARRPPPKRRACLCCREPFMSDWAGHRICDDCQPQRRAHVEDYALRVGR